MWVRGLKHRRSPVTFRLVLSHPVWVRGLKRADDPRYFTTQAESHPVWVRGLKHQQATTMTEAIRVAPRVGAWIETKIVDITVAIDKLSHPVWVRGLKQS